MASFSLENKVFIRNLLIFLLFFAFDLEANKFDYRYNKAFEVQRLSIEDGLSQSVVNDIVQDENGFIWLATEDGLNRYDGYEFVTFQHDHQIPNSLHENFVTSLALQPGVGLWVGTYKGLSFFDFKTESFFNYTNLYPELNSYISYVSVIGGNKVFLATENGLFFKERKNDPNSPFLKFTLSDKLKYGSNIRSIEHDQNYIYVAMNQCIFRLSHDLQTTQALCEEDRFSLIKNLQITKILLDKHVMWIGTKSGLFSFNQHTNRVEKFQEDSPTNSIASDFVTDLSIDKQSNLWIATDKGISIFDNKTKMMQSYSQMGLGNSQLSAYNILCSFVDRDGFVWLGLYGRGVNLLNPNQQRFDHLLTQQDSVELEVTNAVNGITKDRFENLWIGSWGGGLIKYNLITGDISKPLKNIDSEYDKFVQMVTIDKNDHLWISSLNGLFVYDLEKQSVVDLNVKVEGVDDIELIRINNIYEDNKGKLWILSAAGLFREKSRNENYSKLKGGDWQINFESWNEKLPVSFSEHSTMFGDMVEDQNDNLWIGGYHGVLYYERAKDSWLHFTYDQAIPNSLSNDVVQTIYLDTQGLVWVGTADGLNLVREVNSPSGRIFYFDRITTHEGLPNNTIYGIKQDDQDAMWITTTRGLVKYDRIKSKMDLFRSIDGLSSDEFNLLGAYSDEDDRIYLSSINGITSIVNPHTEKNFIADNLKLVKVKARDLMANAFELNSNQDQEYEIEHGVALEVWLSTMNYFKLGSTVYRYRISGYDNNWVELKGNRKLFIAGLTSGEYKLEVQSRLPGNQWPEKSVHFKFKVKSNFIESREFTLLVFALLIAIFAFILFIVAKYFGRQIETATKKQVLETLRVKELRIDKDSLILTNSEKDRKIATLNREIEVSNSKIDIERFRDITTGFYRFQYVEEDDSNLYHQEIKYLDPSSTERRFVNHDGLNNYDLAVIIEFMDFKKIVQSYGLLEGREFLSQASIQLRKETTAGSQFYTLFDGKYIMFNSNEGTQNVVNSLIHLCSQLDKSSYDIANGRTINCLTSITYVKLNHIDLKRKTELLQIKKFLEQGHDYTIESEINHSNSYITCITVNRNFNSDGIIKNLDFESMLKDGSISVQTKESL